MRTIADDNAVGRDDAAADDRVGCCPTKSSFSVGQRPPHPPGVVYHFFWNSAST
jgi:hypothetical protein